MQCRGQLEPMCHHRCSKTYDITIAVPCMKSERATGDVLGRTGSFKLPDRTGGQVYACLRRKAGYALAQCARTVVSLGTVND